MATRVGMLVILLRSLGKRF